MKKFALTLLLVLANMAFALADDVQFAIGMDTPTFTIGESKSVELLVVNDIDLIGLQCDITVPEGIEIDVKSASRTGRLTRGTIVQMAKQDANVYRLIVTNASKEAFGGESGEGVVAFTMTANDKIKSKGTLTITEATATTVVDNVNTQVDVPDFEMIIRKEAKLDGEVSFYAEAETFMIKAGEEYTVNMVFDNEPDNLTGMNGRITLPEGLTLVKGADGMLGYTDRIQNDAALTYNAATGKFSFISMSATPILGNSGTLFTFTVKADENLAEESEIRLTELTITDLSANDFELPDVTIKVLDGVIAEVKQQQEANDAAFTELTSELQALQEELDAVKETIAENDLDFTDDVEAIQNKIDAEGDRISEANEAVSLTADDSVDESIAADIEALKEAVNQAIDEKKAAEEAAAAAQQAIEAAIADKLAEIDDYARNRKVEVSTHASDVAATFQKQIDDVVATLKDDVDAAREEGTLTAETVDVNAVKDAIDAIYAEAVKAQKNFDKLAAQLDELDEALEALDDIDYDAMNEDDAADIKAQVEKLHQQLDDAREALAQDQETLADKSLKDVLGSTKTAFLSAIDAVKKAAEDAIMTATGIASVTMVKDAASAYTLSGSPTDTVRKGQVVIVRMADGTTRKVKY